MRPLETHHPCAVGPWFVRHCWDLRSAVTEVCEAMQMDLLSRVVFLNKYRLERSFLPHFFNLFVIPSLGFRLCVLAFIPGDS